MGDDNNERGDTPNGATTRGHAEPGRGGSPRSGRGRAASGGLDPAGDALNRLVVAILTAVLVAAGVVVTRDLVAEPLAAPSEPADRPSGDAEIPSVWDELGPDHGAFSGLVPRFEDLRRAAAEDSSAAEAPTPEDADPDTLVAEPTDGSDESVTVDIDSIRDEMHEVELPVESESEPEPESQSGYDEIGVSGDVENEWCSGIAHLLPGAGDEFASGVWVWAHETRDLDGRWVWISEEPDHPCFADNTPAGIQQVEGHDAFVFVWAYGEAREASDVDGLLNLVHPAIRGLFGDDSCRELFGHSPWAVVSAEAVDIGEIQPWHFEFDTGVVSFPEAVPVGVHHVLHDDGEMTIPFTLPIVAGRTYLAVDCDGRPS